VGIESLGLKQRAICVEGHRLKAPLVQRCNQNEVVSIGGMGGGRSPDLRGLNEEGHLEVLGGEGDGGTHR
jgi:hypothetical protein